MIKIRLAICALAVAAFAQAGSASAAETYSPALAQIGVTPTLQALLNGSGVSVAVLDGYADVTHPDLAGRLQTVFVYPGTFSAFDLHATHVSGIIGAAVNGMGVVGVAPNVTIFNYPVFDNNGWVAADLGRKALDDAKLKGVAAVSMSYGPVRRGDVFLDGELNIFDDYLNNFVIVRAAGNSGIKAGNEYYSGNASINLGNLLIVGSVESNNAISSFSTTPGSACIAATSNCTAANKMMNFFIVAPGRSILSDAPGGATATLSGTSMATPFVTGAVALVVENALAKSTTLTPTQVASILKWSATDLGAKGVDAVYGWGLLNVGAALGPVGQSFFTTTSTVSSGGISTSNTRLSRSSAMGGNGIASAFTGAVFFDEFGRPFDASGLGKSTNASESAFHQLSGLAGSLSGTPSAQFSGDGTMAFTSTGDGALGGVNILAMGDEKSRLVMGYGMPMGFFDRGASASGAHGGVDRLARQFVSGAGSLNSAFDRSLFGAYDQAVSDRLRLTGMVFSGLGAGEGGSDTAALFSSDRPSANYVSSGADLRLSERSSLAVSYGVMNENGALLGTKSSGAYQLASGALTQEASLNLGFDLSARSTMSFYFDGAFTNKTGSSSELVSSISPLLSTRFGLDFARKDLFSTGDRLTLSLGRPLSVASGEANMRIATSREMDGTVNYETRTVSLASGMPLELGLGYRGQLGALAYGLDARVSEDISAPAALAGSLIGGVRLGF